MCFVATYIETCISTYTRKIPTKTSVISLQFKTKREKNVITLVYSSFTQA